MNTKKKFDEEGFQIWLREVYDWIYKIHHFDLGDISSANRDYLMEVYEDGEQAIDVAIEFNPRTNIEPE